MSKLERLHEAALHATRQGVQSPTSERAGSETAMLVTRRNERAVQSGCSALVHRPTSQR